MSRVALAALLLSAALPASARDITGQVGYMQRIALDPGAQLVVELTGPGGPAGDLHQDTAGAQVPLPFTLTTADQGDLTLRAALVVGGAPQWVSAPIAVPAGEGAVDLGLIQLDSFVPAGFSSRMRCGATPVDLGLAGEKLQMRVGGKDYVLAPVEAASGARFSDGATPETSFWSKGNEATVTLAGQDLPGCVPSAATPQLPLVARGNEPGWVLTLAAEGMVLSTPDSGETRAALPPAESTADGTVFATDALSVTVTPSICRDSMSGMVFPLTVSVTAGERNLDGCGGEPAQMLDGNWAVTQLDGAPVPDSVKPTMTFVAGSVFGSTGCNRYNAMVHLTGEGLMIMPGPMTMMACDDPAGTVEQGFMKALAGVTRFDFDEATGALVLMAQDRPVVTASPAP